MPSTIEGSGNSGSEEVWGTRKRHAAEEEDELRLLGRYSNDDAGAVLIGKPISRSMPFYSQTRIPSGGPRPTNTLNISVKSRPHTAQPAKSKLRGGETNQLQFETRRGSNVKAKLYATQYGEEAFAESSPKRRKTSHQSSSTDSGRSDDDRLDKLDPATVTFGPGHASQGPGQSVSTRSFNSQASIVQKPRQQKLGGLPEYRGLEDMMSSNPASKKQQKLLNGGKNQQRIYGSLSSLLPSSPSNPIDISEVDDDEKLDTKPTVLPNPRYQGTAKKPLSELEAIQSNSSKLIRGRSTGKRSPFFGEPSMPVTRTNGNRSQHQGQTKVRNEPGKPSDRLNDRFIPVNGERRASGVSMSSELDELQSVGTTVGNNQETYRCLPSKRSRNNSPTIGPNSIPDATFPDEGPEIPRSNIKLSKFTSVEPKVRDDRRSVGKVREKKASWSVDLAAVSTSGHFLDDNSIALVRDEKGGDYFVAANGGYTNIKIQPQKLLRILYEDSGRRVRFISAISGTDDNVVDLEFRKEKDVRVLLNLPGFREVKKVESCPSNHMEKIFKKRRSEYRTTDRSLPTILMDRHTVTQAGTSGLRRGHDDQSQPHKAEDNTRQRPGSKLVDELFHRAGLPEEAPTEPQNPKPMRNGIPCRASVSQVFENSKPIRNGHLTRSTRACTLSKKPPEDLFDDHEDYPELERFSKTHGLGDPWKKPLTYPLVGKKKTTVEFSDLERLDEGEYLNDSLISFQLRFLEHTMEEQRPDLAKRVYFFNTFFFATLMNTHKGRKGFNYEGVQKWTRNVDLFTYDYIVVPINDSLHWYLAIICNLPALERGLDLSDEKPESLMGSVTALTGRNQEDGLLSSSPTINLPEGDSMTLVEEMKEPDERGARDSFAELTLDVHAAQPIAEGSSGDQQAEATNLAGEDQEMLDVQVGRAMSRSPNRNIVEKNAKEPEEHPVEDPYQPPKAAADFKRGKRKSMPPVTKIDPSKPAIITFDSLGLARSSTVRILKDYLREEAKAKRGGMEFEPGQIKGITASMIPLQENWYDCGLFVLGYVAKLLEDDPKDFITKVIRREYDVHKDWPNLKPSTARKSIREQLLKLHVEQEVKRQKERDSQKAGKSGMKQGSKVQSGSSGAASPARTIQQETRDDNKGVHEAAKDPREPLSPVRPPLGDDGLKPALSLPAYDFEGDVKNLMQLHGDHKTNEASIHEIEREIEERQPNRRSPCFGASEEGKKRKTMSGSFADEPSVIVVDSQSQQEEAPRSFRHSQPSRGAQVSVEEAPELPAVIQDSQPSEKPSENPLEPSKMVADIVRRGCDAAERLPINKRNVQKVQAVLVETPREPKRRKTGREGVPALTQQYGRKNHTSKATREHHTGLSDWAKHSSSRKLDRRARKADEVINIDD